jgi:hypothetical protein
MADAAIRALPDAGLGSGRVYHTVTDGMYSSVISASVIHILYDVDLAVSGPVGQTSCPKRCSNGTLAREVRAGDGYATWPCSAPHWDMCQVENEETFREAKFALNSDAGSPGASGGVDIGTVGADIDQV